MMKRDTRSMTRHTLFIDTDDAAFWLAAATFVDDGASLSPTQINERRVNGRQPSHQEGDVASRFASANSVRRRPTAPPSPPPLPGLVPLNSLPVVKPLKVPSRSCTGAHLASPAAIGPTSETMFTSPRPAPPTPDVVAGRGASPLSPVSPLPPPMRKVNDETSGLLPAASIRRDHLYTPASPCPSSPASSSLMQSSPRLDDSHMSTQTFSSAGLHHAGATIISAFPSPPQRQQKASAIHLIDYNAARKLALEEQSGMRPVAANEERAATLRLATKPLPLPPSEDETDEAPLQARLSSPQPVASTSLDLDRLASKQASNAEFAQSRTNALRPQHSFDALCKIRSDSPSTHPVRLPATPPGRRLISTVRSHDRSGQRSGSPAQKHLPKGSSSPSSTMSQSYYLSDTPPPRVNPDDWDLPWQQVHTHVMSRHQRQASSKSSTASSGGGTFTSSGASSTGRTTPYAESQSTTPPWARTQLNRGTTPSMGTIPERKQLAAPRESPRRSPSPRKLNKQSSAAYFASAVEPFPLDMHETGSQSSTASPSQTADQMTSARRVHWEGGGNHVGRGRDANLEARALAGPIHEEELAVGFAL